MGFLEPQVLANETVNRVMIENDSAVSNVRKRGRPRKFDLTYEDMLKYIMNFNLFLVLTTGMILSLFFKITWSVEEVKARMKKIDQKYQSFSLMVNYQYPNLRRVQWLMGMWMFVEYAKTQENLFAVMIALQLFMQIV